MSTVIAHAKKGQILPSLFQRSSISVNLDSGLLGSLAVGALDVSWLKLVDFGPEVRTIVNAKSYSQRTKRKIMSSDRKSYVQCERKEEHQV